MKKQLILASALALGVAGSSFAESESSELRRASVFFGSAIAGAVVAGPAGMMVAAISGIWLDQQVEKAELVDEFKAELSDAKSELSGVKIQLGSLSSQLIEAQNRTQQYAQQHAQAALEQLQLNMLFKTGESDLTTTGKQRLAILAEFLERNLDIDIRLDGYSDPRGDSNYNLTLSEARVAAVAEELVLAGVEISRIESYSHGASQSISGEGDYDSYALERMVSIELTQLESLETVAQVIVSQ